MSYSRQLLLRLSNEIPSLLLNGHLTRVWKKRSRRLRDKEHLSSRALLRNNINVYKIN
jgi:hypothetical protein